MSPIDFRKLAKSIFKTILKPPIKERVDLMDICDNALRKKYPRLSSLQRAEMLDNLLKKLKALITKKIEYCGSQKIAPEYEFSIYPDVIVSYSKKYKELKTLVV